MREILPIGTVVKLKESADVLLMITGYFPENEKGERKEYMAVIFPLGVIEGNQYLIFYEEDIKEIVFRGYENENYETMSALIRTSDFFKDWNKESEQEN